MGKTTKINTSLTYTLGGGGNSRQNLKLFLSNISRINVSPQDYRCLKTTCIKEPAVYTSFVFRRDVWMQVNYVNIYINNHNTTKQIAAPKPTDFRLLLRNNITSVRK